MPGPEKPPLSDVNDAALRQGRGEGLALAAVALAVVAFINLLGAEKAILAVVLGVLARRHAMSKIARRRSGIAIALGVLQLGTVAVVLVLFRDRLGQLLDLLKTLG
jgi:hypothetical protein